MKEIIKYIFYKFLTFIKNILNNSKRYILNNYYLLKYKVYKSKKEKVPNSKNTKSILSNKDNIFTKNVKVIFIYRSYRKDHASTIMRGFQLKKILKEEGDIEADIIDEKFVKNIRESVCILNKSFLLDASAKEFEILKSNKNILCLDYVDSEEKLYQIYYSHCLIASSLKQFSHFRNKYKNYLVHLITHHVDPRLNKVDTKIKSLKIGYFGEKENGLYIKRLDKHVYPFFIKTNNGINNLWLKEISNYNAHYIARKIINKNVNVYKPFLKGFTAAFTNSNVLVCKDEGDSLFYLTEDYPYLIKDRSFISILKMIEYMKNTYNSDIWFKGLEIMRDVRSKSNNSFIIKEFNLLLNLLFYSDL